MAPKKATKKPVVKKTMSVKTNPIEKLSQSRREFFTSLQGRLQSLPDSNLLPSSLSEEVRAYSRTQGSEKGMLKAIDCTVGHWKDLLSFLLEPHNLECSNLEPLVQKFIASLVIRDELGLTEDPLSKLSYDERIVYRVRQYAREHLSRFILDLPIDIKPTDRSLDLVQKDFEKIFPIDNPFSGLFESYIPPIYIKSWLAQTDFHSPPGRLDIRRAVHQFIQEHRFHRLKDLLDQGFNPKSAHDWEVVVGAGFFESLPLAFWRLTTWQQIDSINQELQKFSLSVHDYFRLLHEKEDKTKLLLVEGKKKTKGAVLPTLSLGDGEKKDKIVYQVPKNLLKMPTQKEMIVNLRIRSDLPGFVSHIISPVGEASNYCGQLFRDNLFFPSDSFFKDRVDSKTKFENKLVTIISEQYDPPKSFCFRVFYLFRDNQIVPQTARMFQQEQDYLSKEKGIQIPNLKSHLLLSPLESLAIQDIDIIRSKLKGEITSLLNQVYVKKLNTDTITQEIESGCFFGSKTLDEYLSRMFRVFLLVHPRYQFSLVFPEMKDRLNLFFYKLGLLGRLPLSLLFPRLETLDESVQEVFFQWIEKATNEFKQDVLCFLLNDRYPFLRLPIQTVGHSAAPVVLHDTERSVNYLFLMSYHEHLFNICDVCSATKHDELVVDGKSLPENVLETIRNFVDVGRVKLRQGAFLEDTGFELVQEENIGLPLETPVVSVQSEPLHTQNLPGFKQNAMAFLEGLLLL